MSYIVGIKDLSIHLYKVKSRAVQVAVLRISNSMFLASPNSKFLSLLIILINCLHQLSVFPKLKALHFSHRIQYSLPTYNRSLFTHTDAVHVATFNHPYRMKIFTQRSINNGRRWKLKQHQPYFGSVTSQLCWEAYGCRYSSP